MQSLPQPISLSHSTQRHTPPPFSLPTKNITDRASIAYHCAMRTPLWRKQLHQRNLLFLTNEDPRVSDALLCILQIV